MLFIGNISYLGLNDSAGGPPSNYSKNLFCDLQVADQNSVFPSLAILVLLCSLLADMICLALSAALRHATTLPINVRFLLYNHVIGCILLTSSLLVQSIYDLWAQATDFWPIQFMSCTDMQILRMFSTTFVSLLLVVGGVERFVATRRAFRGWDQSHVSKMVLSSIGLVATFSVGLTICQIYGNSGSDTIDMKICYCDVVLVEHPKFFPLLYFVRVYVVVECIIILILCILWIVGRKKLKSRGMNTAQHSLSERMNILNNLAMTKTIMPMLTAHGFFTVSALICIILGAKNVLENRSFLGVLLLQLANLLLSCYTLIFPILCLISLDNMRQSFAKVLCLGPTIDFIFYNNTEWKNRRQKKYINNNVENDKTDETTHNNNNSKFNVSIANDNNNNNEIITFKRRDIKEQIVMHQQMQQVKQPPATTSGQVETYASTSNRVIFHNTDIRNYYNNSRPNSSKTIGGVTIVVQPLTALQVQ
uniref:G-protein coupled receptors family 1 profile domain-containing protein n=1 Tax=Romanomermis culicivorax TaxID=13658 RepID=A0A915IL81_ROMCU